MPLILVIVADPHEAAQLATLIQGRLPVDLVQAAEVGEGLLALEDRIPDLILTSPLMSPFDDGVLDEYLRDLGTAGAHVQTLRIPVLSQAPKKTKRLGFSLRRRSKSEAPTIDGCEPKVFADEIEQYLARAAEEKRHASSSDQSPAAIEREEVPEPVIAEEQWTAAYSEDAPAVSAPWSAPEPQPEAEADPEPVAWRADLLDRPPVEETPIYQPTRVAYEEASVADEGPSVDCESPIQEEAEAATTWQEEAVSEPAPVDEVIEPEALADADVVEAVVASGFSRTVIEEPQIEEPQIEEAPVAVVPRTPSWPDVDENKATPSFKAALAAIRAAWGKPPRKGDSPVGVPESPGEAPTEADPVVVAAETPASFEVDLTDVVEVLDEEPMDVDPRAAATTQHAPVDPVAETVDVYELSVEPDLSELETELITPAAPQRERPAPKTAAAAPVVGEHAAAVESAPAAAADANGGRKKGKRTTKSPKTTPPRQAKALAAQNEWGVFDPNQCGFAALVDKLDEVADEKTKQPQGTGTKARVISLS